MISSMAIAGHPAHGGTALRIGVIAGAVIFAIPAKHHAKVASDLQHLLDSVPQPAACALVLVRRDHCRDRTLAWIGGWLGG